MDVGTPTAGQNSDAGKLKKLAQRVEQTLSENVVFQEPKQLDPRTVLVAPGNRDGAPPNVQHVHQQILKSFIQKGFDRSRPQVGICIEYKSGEGKAKLLEHNKRFSKGVTLMPPIHDDVAVYGSLAGSHLNIALRLIQSGSPSPAGDLKALMEDESSSLCDVVRTGHRWWILKENTDPAKQVEISLWRNQDQNENQGIHEIEILQTIAVTMREMGQKTGSANMGDIVARADRRNPAKVSTATLQCLTKFFVQFSEGGNKELLEELVDFHSTYVNPREVVVSTAFFQALVKEPVLMKCPHVKLYLLLTNYTTEKVRTVPGCPSQAGFLDVKLIESFVKKPDQVTMLEDKVKDLRGRYLPILGGTLARKQASNEFAQYMILVFRCLFAKPWPSVFEAKLKHVPAGKFTVEKMKDLAVEWAAYLDEKFPELVFAQSASLQRLPEGDDESQQIVNLENISAKGEASGSSVGGVINFKRFDRVTVIRRMSWVIPVEGKDSYRKDIMEGTEGIIEGYADFEQRQVLLKVEVSVNEGRKGPTTKWVTHNAFPRNLKLTSEYLLEKAGAAASASEPKGSKDKTAGGTKKAPPAWALQDSPAEAVRFETKWSSVLADDDTLNQIFWLRSRIRMSLEALSEHMPKYTEKAWRARKSTSHSDIDVFFADRTCCSKLMFQLPLSRRPRCLCYSCPPQ